MTLRGLERKSVLGNFSGDKKKNKIDLRLNSKKAYVKV